MVKGQRRVLLFCSGDLFGETLESLLTQLEEVILIGPLPLDDKMLSQIGSIQPDVVLIAGEGASAELASTILENYPNLPVIQSAITSNVVRVFTSREMPARKADLLDAIRPYDQI